MNKLNKIYTTMALGLCLASCSIINAPITKRQPTTAPTKTQTTATAQQPAQSAPQLEAVQPAISSEIAGMVQGEWVIVAAGQYRISQDEEMPYLHFDEANGKFYSSNGCNVLNGTFAFTGVSDITFDNVLSTRKYCPDIKYEQAINAVIKDGTTVRTKFENIGNETVLYFMGKNGNKVMTLRRHNMEKLNGQWEVMQIGKIDIDNPDVNIFLDIPDLTIHGNTGCNFFNGIIYIDADVPNSISFAQMSATMKACPNSDIEMAMLVALEQVHSYSLSGAEVMHLLDQQGKRVITLKRTLNIP